MRKFLLISLSIVVLVPSGSFAIVPHQPLQLTSFIYADPGYTDNSLWITSPDWPSYVIGEVGFPPPESRWHIGQWGIDPSNPLLPIKTGSRVSWQVRARDAKVRVSLYGRRRMIDLWHSTEDPYYDQNQVCHESTTSYPSAEFDLLISPNMLDDPDLLNDQDLPQSFLQYGATPPLSEIKQLYLRAQQRLVNVGTSYRCGYDSAVTLLAVVFINTVADPVQKLYYQLMTFDTRWPGQNTDGWFYNGEVFEGIANYGYDDSIKNYNASPLVEHGVWRNFNLPIHSRIAHLIETSTNPIDKDLSGRVKITYQSMGKLSQL